MRGSFVSIALGLWQSIVSYFVRRVRDLSELAGFVSRQMAGSAAGTRLWFSTGTGYFFEAALCYVAVDRPYALHGGVEEASAPVALLPGVDAASLAAR